MAELSKNEIGEETKEFHDLLSNYNEMNKYIQTINLDQLKTAFKKDYVILQIHLNNKDVDYISNKYNVFGFAKDVTGKISIRELMLAADIIIGDYDDALLESPLIGVPVIIRKWPSDMVEVNNKTTIKLEENPYGKVVITTDDLIDNAVNRQQDWLENRREFTRKFLQRFNVFHNDKPTESKLI